MKKKLQRGQPLEELVKGSMDYTMQMIRDAFRSQFPNAEGGDGFWLVEIFADHVIVSNWGKPELKADEYWKVTYSREGDAYTFAPRDQWEVVELAYQPRTSVISDQSSVVSEGKKRKSKKFEERVDAKVLLEEAQEGKPRRIKIEGAITADIVNGNKRRYRTPVLEPAIAELCGHLNESAGQGRAVQILGEAEHPSDKGGRPSLLETVTKWQDVSFDGRDVNVIGRILETSKGKDILTLMEGGVMPGVSLRGYGDGKYIQENGEKIFEVTELHITGFDLVLEPSFENAAELIESQNQSSMEDEMTLEELLKLLKDHPEAFEGLTETQVKKLGDAQLKALEEKVREALGIDANANITESLKATSEKARKFDEAQALAEVEKAITEACKELPFGDKLNKQFTEAMKNSGARNAEDVKAIAEAKRKEYGAIAAELKLGGMGFNERTRASGMAPVIEFEQGNLEHAQGALMLLESVQRFEKRTRSSLKEHEESPAAVYTKMLLERFDKLHGRELMQESKLLQEAELVSDLNLPYSVSRAIIEEAFPNLVSANIFDVGIMENSPSRLYFEATTGESGYSATATNEVVTGGAEGVWYALAHGRVTPATVTVTSNPAGTTYVEGTDYVIDYAAGRIKFLAAGSINTNDVLVTYTYTAIRQGEMAPIERVKTSLTYKTIEAAADRIADQISREAFIFSQSQLGWDAIARTMANLIRQLQRKIDQGMLYAAYSAVLSVASNATDTWTIGTTQDDYATLYRLLGEAAVIVAKRFYVPTFYLASVTNADRLSNWEGFKRDGFPQALLNAAGFVGMVKTRPVFSSTEFPDSLWIAGNRELVQHRVFQPTIIKGPYPSYDVSGGTSKIVAAEQYYAEQFDCTESPVNEKGAYVPVAEAGS